MGAEGCTPSPAVQLTDREGGCVQKAENQGARQRSDSPRVGRRPYNSQVLVMDGPRPRVLDQHLAKCLHGTSAQGLCAHHPVGSVSLSPLPHLTPTSQPQHTRERWCAGWGSRRRQRPPRTTLPLSTALPMASPAWSLGPHSSPGPGPAATQSARLPGAFGLCHTRPMRTDGRKAQTCPATRPHPTLLPDPQRKESELGFRANSPAGLSPVSACVSVRVQTPTSAPRGQEPGQAPPCLPGRCAAVVPRRCLQPCLLCAPPTPPTVRSSWGLKKEASYPRGSTCKEKQDSRHGRKVRHCLGLLREQKAKTLLILAKNKTRMHVPRQVLPWASGAKRTGPTDPTGWPHNMGTWGGSLSPGPFWGVQWACAGPTIPPSLVTGWGACSELSLTLRGPRGATASCLGGPCKREGCQEHSSRGFLEQRLPKRGFQG